MKKFVSGFLVGALISAGIGTLAVQYVASPVDFKVLVNGEEFVSNPPALEVEGRTYLPLRAMGEALGVPGTWNEEARQAEVGSAKPASSESGYSRNNPAPIGTSQTYTYDLKYFDNDKYTVSVRVLDVVRGDKAYNDLNDSLMFSYTKPDDGYEYMNVKIALSVISTEADFSVDATSADFDAYTSNNEECPSNYYPTVEPALRGNLYEGGNVEGWITVQVKKDDAKPKLVYGADYNGQNGIWFALYE